MAAKHVWFQPTTGNASESEHDGWWRIVCEDKSVSILGKGGTLIGSGRWTGKSIKQRYAVDAPIDSSTWSKLEHALRRSFAGTLHDAYEAPARVAPPRQPVARGAHGLVNLHTGELSPGTDTAAHQVHVSLDRGAVTITDHAGQVATAHFDGEFLGKREPGASALSGDVTGWSRVEQAVRALASGAAVMVPRPIGAPVAVPAGYLEATVQMMSGEIVDRRLEPSTEPIDNVFLARIALDGDRVKLTDQVGTATARWDGTALVDRDANDSTLQSNAAQWTVVETVVATLARELRESPAIVATRELDRESGPAPEPAGPPRDARSGWWALGATLIAAVGALAAWELHERGDTFGLVIAIALTVIAAGLGIYTLYGVTTRCPRCKAWYRRETTSVENLGSSTYTRQESKAVYDSSGKQTGTTYETVTYVRTRYRYHYKCKECSNRWTGTGTSESRA